MPGETEASLITSSFRSDEQQRELDLQLDTCPQVSPYRVVSFLQGGGSGQDGQKSHTPLQEYKYSNYYSVIIS